jgi:heme/copper-type cytochrome/quinol oxidase subunit 1
VLGLFVDGGDTCTPAHYHGVIAGVTLAVMGTFWSVILPLLGRAAASPRLVRLQIHLFAWGQLAACIGLFIAGGHGAPRKTAGDAQALVEIGAKIGMGLNGLGGLVAVAGGILFVWMMAQALLRPPRYDQRAAAAAPEL